MEERSGARRVTQQHLGDPPVESAPEDAPEAPLVEPTTGPSDPAPLDPSSAPSPRGPSDLELRERQRAWRVERARFERSQRRPPLADEDSK